jgi:hypothetical protein
MHEVGCFVEITPPHIRTHFLAQHIAICLHPILLPYLCNMHAIITVILMHMRTIHHMVWYVAAGVCSSPALRSNKGLSIEAVDMFI